MSKNLFWPHCGVDFPVHDFNWKYNVILIRIFYINPNSFRVLVRSFDRKKIVQVEAGWKNNYFETIDAEMFKGMSNLEELKLFGCSIKNITDDAFSDLKSLTHLDLSLNKIEKLSEKVFWSLENLEKLYLYNSQIEEVPENLFQYNRKLKMLDMHTNKIKTLPFGFLHSLAELESFSISGNELKVIHRNTFQQNKKLKWLWLYSNRIGAFGLGTFYGLKKLSYLDLTRNRCIDKQYGKWGSEVPINLGSLSSDLVVCASNHDTDLEDLMKKLKNNFEF